MNIRDTLLAANEAGNFLETLTSTSYDDVGSVADAVSSLHNCEKIDFLTACNSPQLNAVSSSSFFALRHVFCQTLPQLDCSVDAAVTACERMFEKAGLDGAAVLVYDSLSSWFKKSLVRVSEGLALIRRDMDVNRRLVRPVLLAGASHDATMSSEEALDLSNQAQMRIRLDAIWALGRIVPIEEERILTRAIDRLGEAVETPASNDDTAHGVEAALHLLHRTDGGILQAVEPLIVKACSAPAPATLYALASGLQTRRMIYSQAMIDASFSALQHVSKQDVHTIQAIDSILYQSDLDEDRQRVLKFPINLLSNSDNAIDFDSLSNFRHKLRNEQGAVLGWYVVSLLLAGDYRLCFVANHLLPYNQVTDGLDIDLGPFSLTSPWLLYLSHKILGYCLINKESTAALLLSCLRAAADENRAGLESLVRVHLLTNYLTAIDLFESNLSPNDPARCSVERLSQAMKSYVDGLDQSGTCPAFRPTARERQLEGYRLGDLIRSIQKKAEENSIFSIVAHKATLLYGTASNAYIYRDDHSAPDRQEISLATFEHRAEIPRMEVIDPIGLHYATYRFRSARPPS